RGGGPVRAVDVRVPGIRPRAAAGGGAADQRAGDGRVVAGRDAAAGGPRGGGRGAAAGGGSQCGPHRGGGARVSRARRRGIRLACPDGAEGGAGGRDGRPGARARRGPPPPERPVSGNIPLAHGLVVRRERSACRKADLEVLEDG